MFKDSEFVIFTSFVALFTLFFSTSYDFALCLLSVIYSYSSHFFIIRLTFLFSIPPFFIFLYLYSSRFFIIRLNFLFFVLPFYCDYLFPFYFPFYNFIFSSRLFLSLSLHPPLPLQYLPVLIRSLADPHSELQTASKIV